MGVPLSKYMGNIWACWAGAGAGSGARGAGGSGRRRGALTSTDEKKACRAVTRICPVESLHPSAHPITWSRLLLNWDLRYMYLSASELSRDIMGFEDEVG